jgi:hypothetical protein
VRIIVGSCSALSFPAKAKESSNLRRWVALDSPLSRGMTPQVIQSERNPL